MKSKIREIKKTLVALSAVAFLFGACTQEATDNPVTVSLDKMSATEMGLVGNDKHIHIHVTNSTDQETTINWERSETQAVTGWTYMVGGSSAASGTLTIPAGGTSMVMLVINPNGTAGNGTGTLKFYDAADQAATMKTFTYDLTTVAEYFRLAPVGSTSGNIRANDPNTDYHLWVINENATTVTVEWMRTAESSNPSAWDVAVCTDLDCFTPAVLSETMTIAPGDSVDFKTTFSHNATPGTGGTTPVFYVASDSANSIVSTYAISHVVTN